MAILFFLLAVSNRAASRQPARARLEEVQIGYSPSQPIDLTFSVQCDRLLPPELLLHRHAFLLGFGKLALLVANAIVQVLYLGRLVGHAVDDFVGMVADGGDEMVGNRTIG